MLQEDDKHYINLLRGASVLRVMLAHLGLAWFYSPYSEYIGIFFPVLFFVSGAVSYYSFCRANSKYHYLCKRCLGIAVPFLVFMLPIALIYAPQLFEFNFTFIMKWLVLRPDASLFPFPIGQIWFITCLLMCALISFIFFYLQAVTHLSLIAILVVSIAMPAFISYPEFEQLSFYNPSFLSKYILFEVLALFQFFMFGAFYVSCKHVLNKAYMLVAGVVLLSIWLAIDVYARHSSQLSFSEVRPNTYIFQSFAVILILLGAQSFILKLVSFTPRVVSFILYCNTHAYSIFILHIPILYTLEYLLGWHDLSGQPVIALIRLILVVGLSLVAAIPFSWLHKKLTANIKQLLGVS